MKRLYRKKETGKIAGVCSGIGEYFNIDTVFIRIIFIVSIFINGIGLIAYLVAWIIMPIELIKNDTSKGEKGMAESDISVKSRLGALLFCLLLGWLGVHRFYVGKTGTGILMILTVGGCGIWWTIDLILIIIGSFTDKGGKFVIEWMPKHVRSG